MELALGVTPKDEIRTFQTRRRCNSMYLQLPETLPKRDPERVELSIRKTHHHFSGS